MIDKIESYAQTKLKARHGATMSRLKANFNKVLRVGSDKDRLDTLTKDLEKACQLFGVSDNVTLPVVLHMTL